MDKVYELPKLAFAYDALAPHISEQQLTIHHQKHHQAYVNAANKILERIDQARKDNIDIDMKATLKDLSFQIGGHLLHSLFWENLSPKGGGVPGGRIAQLIEKEFGSFDRFKKEFTQAAAMVEGSGWAALTFCKLTNRPIIMQIEKHNTNVYPMFNILLVLDVFEHAYYLDYKNDRAKFIEAFWNIVNWDAVNKRLG
ncbi:MAG: superoxide dismutase [Candidatus Woesearchaeota archaeon]